MRHWFQKSVLPHVAALVVFAAVAALFFAPQFEGRVLRQGDMVRASGMGQDIKEHVQTYGEHPQWAGRMFGGMPAYMIDMNYDGRWVKQVGDLAYGLREPAGWIFVAMAGFYLMLVMMGVNPWLGIIGGVGYGLSSYFIIIIGAGHVTKMLALAWVAPMVGALWYAYRRRMWLGAALAGLFAAVVIATSHLQIPYYFLFVLVALVISEFVRAYRERALVRFVRVSGALLAAGVLAVGANFVQLYYVAEHAEDTIRGRSELTELADDGGGGRTSGLDKDYATEWSYGKLETFNLLVPNLYGGGSDFSDDGQVAQALRPYQAPRGYAQSLPSYWGPQRFTEGPVYLGAALILLAVLGLFLLPGREKGWIVAVSVLAVFLAWGRYIMWLTDLFLDYFPLYNKFRTVSMILVIVQWSVPLLAVLGLQRIWDKQQRGGGMDEVLRALKWAVIGVGGVCLAIGLFGPMVSSFGRESDLSYGLPEDILAAMRSERASLLRADAFRSLAFVLLAAGLVWVWVKGWLRRGWFVVMMAGVVTVDLFAVDKRYVEARDFVYPPIGGQTFAVPMTEADRQILRDTTDYRVANFEGGNPFVDGTNATAYYHRSVGGYHAAKLRRYDELITHHLAKMHMAVYDMLNVKYFIMPDQQGGGLRVDTNAGACGSAWYVDRILRVDGADAELRALGDGGTFGEGASFDSPFDPPFDPHRVAVVDTSRFDWPFGTRFDTLSSRTVELVDYRTNRLTYRTSSPEQGVVVFSEIYYPKGWTATVDGVPAVYFRANYVLRAMVVPAGEHEVVFAFASPHFAKLVWITRICSLILLLGTLGLLIQTRLDTWPKREE